MKIRVSATKISLGLLFIALVVLVDFARRDMQLDVDLLRESLMNIPGTAMENIEMAREISGDTWNVKVPYMQQEGNRIELQSIDLTRQMSGDKGEWYFFGHEGTYSNDTQEMRVNRLLGTIEASGRTWNVEGSKMDWQAGKNDFVFPEGLTVYDSEFLIQTKEASMDRNGVILLQKGGVIKWIKPSER